MFGSGVSLSDVDFAVDLAIFFFLLGIFLAEYDSIDIVGIGRNKNYLVGKSTLSH